MPKDNKKKDLSGARELEQCQAELEEFKNIALRAQADLQNFRRRVQEEKMEFARFAKVEFMIELLPTIDHFALASQHIPEDLRERDWVKGIQAIEGQFENVLKSLGLEQIKTTGEKFDPHLHEAIEEIPGEKNTIIEEVQKGYMLGEKVLRPAKVRVGNGN